MNTVTFSDTSNPNAYDKFGVFVQGHSKMRISISAWADTDAGASISSYRTELSTGSVYSGNPVDIGAVKSSGTLTAKVTVTDSKNQKATGSNSCSITSYAPPSISNMTCKRCDSSGTEQQDGTYVKVSFRVSSTSLGSKAINAVSYSIKYKPSTSSSWTIYSTVNTGSTSATVKDLVLEGVTFAADESYDLKVEASDFFQTSEIRQSVSTKEVLIDLMAGGKGIAFGKVSQIVDTIEMGWQTKFLKNIALGNDQNIYGYDADGKLHSALIPWNANGNTVLGIGTYNAESGYTNIYGNRIQLLAKGGYIPVKGALGFSFENCADLYWEDASGTGHNCMNLNENNTLDIGYGLWNTGTGKTNVRGNTLELYAKSGATRLMGSDLRLDNGRRLFWLDTSGTAHNCLQLNTSNDLVLGYGGYSAGVGGTHIYGTDVKFGIKNANSASYTPYYRKGDSITLEYVVTSGYLTNNKQNLYFTVPLSKPVIGSPTVTAVSVSGFILRQDNNYTHGSSADTFVTPTSYITKLTEAGIYIGAVFSTTTNAVNNEPIGVHWSGKITFS